MRPAGDYSPHQRGTNTLSYPTKHSQWYPLGLTDIHDPRAPTLWLFLASVTDRELAQVVQFLQAENAILHAKFPNRITLTTREKARLVKLGTALGNTLKNIFTIASYRTFTRWTSAANDTKAKAKSTRKSGRPKTAEDLRKLVVQLATDNGWGYTRILGELKKLGIRHLSRSTVVNILKHAGLQPGPNRADGSWSEFVQRHAATL